jgi:hypothetical protein
MDEYTSMALETELCPDSLDFTIQFDSVLFFIDLGKHWCTGFEGMCIFSRVIAC